MQSKLPASVTKKWKKWRESAPKPAILTRLRLPVVCITMATARMNVRTGFHEKFARGVRPSFETLRPYPKKLSTGEIRLRLR